MSKFKKIPIKLSYPNELQSHFSSNFVVQHQPDHFILSFFEVFPPPIIGETEEEKKEILENIDHIDAKCIARIILTPDKLEDMIKALQENFDNYLNKKKSVQPKKQE